MPPPPHFIIIIPGGASSKLREPGNGPMVWGDAYAIAKRVIRHGGPRKWLDAFTYPNKLEPAGIVDTKGSGFFRIWEEFSRLTDELSKWRYTVTDLHSADDDMLKRLGRLPKVAYTFSYDFRQSHELSAKELQKDIARCQHYHQDAEVWLLAHSAGGLVARRYIQLAGDHHPVRRLFLMGSPRRGAQYAMHPLIDGPYAVITRWFTIKFGLKLGFREVVRSFPGLYEWIPYQTGFLTDELEQTLEPFDHGPSWLDDRRHVRCLTDAPTFIKKLRSSPDVEHTFCYVGVDKPTITSGRVTAAKGKWTDIRWDKEPEGDDSIPESSAQHPVHSNNRYYAVSHGSIYSHPTLLPQLKRDLEWGPSQGPLVAVKRPDMKIVFQAERDYYEPREPIPINATVHVRDTVSAIPDAEIKVEMEWQGPLLGVGRDQPPADLDGISLAADPITDGGYRCTLTAPRTEGYYLLKATVCAPGQAPVERDDLIAIEREDKPGWARELGL